MASAGSLLARFVRGVKQGFGGVATTKRLVGVDTHGNQYWEKTGTRKPLRTVVPAQGNEFDYDPDTIPELWHGWLRGSRTNPPRDDDIQAEEYRQLVMAAQVEAINEKQELVSATAQRVRESDSEPFSPKSSLYVNHAALKEFTAPEKSETPTSGAGTTFRPGGWNPGKSSD
eukprot:m.93441 g.93441  ORF g.93441 m.93441 type:complete len:172 (-) comp26636_c0_seq1:72-587(-)